ncbi:MAG: translation initiation factor IF-3 [Nitrospinota bacterium]|nr:translation initiation factor IF-3 [Nitrospinota bacterium]
MKKQRVNSMIRVREVTVINDEGESMGVFPTRDALLMAQEQNLDLVEVAPFANPPVCKVMDYGKFKYKQSKRAHEAKKGQKIVHLKEVKFRPNTDAHDYDFKLKHVQRFLEQGDKAKVVIFFKGREIIHLGNGQKILNRVVAATEDFGVVEQLPKKEGRTLVMVLAPKAKKK